jgi:hypothetical protein
MVLIAAKNPILVLGKKSSRGCAVPIVVVPLVITSSIKNILFLDFTRISLTSDRVKMVSS